jgi:transposase
MDKQAEVLDLFGNGVETAVGRTKRRRPATRGQPRVKTGNRQQLVFRVVDIERLVADDHPVRAVWEFVGRLDLNRFYEPIEAIAGVAGRAAWDPRLLISLWIWAYSQGISSAREIARRCAYDPAFQWLAGLEVINHHSLSDFRVGYGEALNELFAQALGLMSAEGLITLERVMHDGTKIKACASADSFRREGKIRAHLEQARQQLAAMGDPRAEEPRGRQQAAQERAVRERQERLERALQELDKIRENKAGPEAKAQARVSLSDPQARIMKQSDGGYAPSYNIQISTDATHGFIVGVGGSQSASDYGELPGSAARIENNMGQIPRQIVADGGFTSRENILAMNDKNIDLIGSLDEHAAQSAGQLERRGVQPGFYPEAFTYDVQTDTYRCPVGKILRHESQENRIGVVHHRYRALWRDCASCPFKVRCCPQNVTKGRAITRTVEHPVVTAFIQKMQTPAAKAIYRLRGAVAEFPNAWLKAKIGLRQFRVRGLAKILMEAIWACLTYNIQQWIRLVWHAQPLAATG